MLNLKHLFIISKTLQNCISNPKSLKTRVIRPNYNMVNYKIRRVHAIAKWLRETRINRLVEEIRTKGFKAVLRAMYKAFKNFVLDRGASQEDVAAVLESIHATTNEVYKGRIENAVEGTRF